MTDYVLEIATAGASGTADTDIPVRGLLMGLKITWPDNTPNTCTTYVAETSGMSRTLFTIGGTVSGGQDYYPMLAEVDSTGTTTGGYRVPYVDGKILQGSLVGGIAGTVTIILEVLTS